MTQATNLNFAKVIAELEDLALKAHRIDEDSADACGRAAALLNAADKVANESKRASFSAEWTGFDSKGLPTCRTLTYPQLIAALAEYEALK